MRDHRGSRLGSSRLKGWLLVTGMLAAAITSLWSSLWAATRPARNPVDPIDMAAGELAFCPHRAGARVADTLGITPAQRAAIPITHVIVLMQENRSFDHYFGKLSQAGQPAADGIPPSFVNRDRDGNQVAPFHLPTTCLPLDPPHQWASMHAHWNGGRMDGFVSEADEEGNGRWTMGYYDASDLPFYYWLARTFALGDRYFSAAMGGTWPNRQILYTGTAHSQRAPTAMLRGARSIFDALDDAGVAWRVYTDGPARQDCIGWTPRDARGVDSMVRFREALALGTLPPVSFLDPNEEDEHPPADVQRGENWARRLYLGVTESPLWPRLAMFLTYDEGGGFLDHVPPPAACPPGPERGEYGRRGGRVPFILISPWARPHHVSHQLHDHASLLRFIELMFDLPALSDRDANAGALLDLFDFSAPRLARAPSPPAAGQGGCKPVQLSSR
ncbi:MAG: alkaline phosphatase family protein [Pseudomonadota bacterium]